VQPTDLIADSSTLSPLVNRLIASAQDDNRRVAELCAAVLRHDWDAATSVAKILCRKLDASPKLARSSSPTRSAADTENCA
jgi:hypothetical protein